MVILAASPVFAGPGVAYRICIVRDGTRICVCSVGLSGERGSGAYCRSIREATELWLERARAEVNDNAQHIQDDEAFGLVETFSR